MELQNIEVVSNSIEAYQKGVSVILTFTNKEVKAINEYQRLKQGTDSLYPGFKIGEKIIATTNYKKQIL